MKEELKPVYVRVNHCGVNAGLHRFETFQVIKRYPEYGGIVDLSPVNKSGGSAWGRVIERVPVKFVDEVEEILSLTPTALKVLIHLSFADNWVSTLVAGKEIGKLRTVSGQIKFGERYFALLAKLGYAAICASSTKEAMFTTARITHLGRSVASAKIPVPKKTGEQFKLALIPT